MPAQTATDDELLSALKRIALKAGRAAHDLFIAGCAVGHKTDNTPVTEADNVAEAIILDGLSKTLPGITVVAEEAVSAGGMPVELGSEFLLVDPLDGTREFVGGKGDFTVNIALIRNGEPALGVVYAPVRGWLFAGRPGHAERADVDAASNASAARAIKVRVCGPKPDVVASHSHGDPVTDDIIAKLNARSVVLVGSSLKFCLIAAGEADIYPRCGRTMQWDTAAGDAVLRAAGGMTTTLDGKPLGYGLRAGEGVDRLANPAFIARGQPNS
ncbi:MAG: 3'(2'),5'-bisphosphate nucleotidase CysQ [Rhizobiaceae bacterium]|nr:3'(2'),5'-bisphosphate nucleotidase CysQ [Rhizobiaceae bacterium]